MKQRELRPVQASVHVSGCSAVTVMGAVTVRLFTRPTNDVIKVTEVCEEERTGKSGEAQ